VCEAQADADGRVAWNELRENSDFIRTSFESTGILIKTDMSHKIKMRGGKGYDFKK
jgi:hypothetical protein